MKVNHRRTNKSKTLTWGGVVIKNKHEDPENGLTYGGLTSARLIAQGCSPNYTNRSGAIAAIRGIKRHRAKQERLLKNKELTRQLKDV